MQRTQCAAPGHFAVDQRQQERALRCTVVARQAGQFRFEILKPEVYAKPGGVFLKDQLRGLQQIRRVGCDELELGVAHVGLGNVG